MKTIMRKILLFILMITSVSSYAQSTRREKVDCFQNAIAAFNNNNLILADSLFTESINEFPTKEAIFNKAIVRFILQDTCTACKYLKIAAKKFDDKESQRIYNNDCILKSDTIFYDKKIHRIEDKSNYRFYEEINTLKCNSVVEGIIHKKNHKATVQLSQDHMNAKHIDVYAMYEILDTIKVFNYNFSSTFSKDNEAMFDAIDNRLKDFLIMKYDFSSIPHSKRFYFVSIIVNEKGSIIDCNIGMNPFDKFSKTTQERILNDIYSALRNLKNLKTDKLFGEPIIVRKNILFEL